LHLHYGDLANAAHLNRLLKQIEPDEVYNLGAQSHVRVSFDQAEFTADIVATGALRLLEAFRDYARESGGPRFYQAGSSEMFGASPPPQQNEKTRFYPRSLCREQGRSALVRGQPARRTISLFATEFSLTTNPRDGVRRSSPARLRAP
jgi:GDP-mannose 4,6-dehydratase